MFYYNSTDYLVIYLLSGYVLLQKYSNYVNGLSFDPVFGGVCLC